MLIIPIIEENLDLLTAVNGGVAPLVTEDRRLPSTWTYMIIEAGENNRIIDRNELVELNKIKDMKGVKATMLMTTVD